MRAMILAAGRGERMRPLTDARPKPLLPVGGKPLIVWHLERLAACGVREIAVNVSWLGEQIEREIGDGRRFGVRIRYSPEPQALETAGGIATALPLLGQAPFLVVNADIWCDFDFGRARTIAAQLQHSALLAWCVLVPNPPHHPGGDFGLESGFLTEHGERLTFSGIGIYSPALFDGLQRGERAPLAPLLRRAARERRAGAELHRGTWSDVGTPQRLAALDAQLQLPTGD
ncbi:MAG TPA: nucleotidyltransferase family protein [Burkholderiaceae bacterium]|nr:nucleotidyltransferase family protein [Burkholderiaceae bacterium]